MIYQARPGAQRQMQAADVDFSLEATERRIKRALAVTSQRIQEQALEGGLTTESIETLARIAAVYRTLAVTAAPFDPTKLSDEDMDRLVKHLEKAR
jgi:hypothetical protein